MSKFGGINIGGSISAGGDIVGGDQINYGSGGEVACDFVWRGVPLKGLCFPDDQRSIQRTIDKYLDGKIGYEALKALVGSLSPNLMAQIERIEKDRG